MAGIHSGLTLGGVWRIRGGWDDARGGRRRGEDHGAASHQLVPPPRDVARRSGQALVLELSTYLTRADSSSGWRRLSIDSRTRSSSSSVCETVVFRTSMECACAESRSSSDAIVFERSASMAATI